MQVIKFETFKTGQTFGLNNSVVSMVVSQQSENNCHFIGLIWYAIIQTVQHLPPDTCWDI